MRNTRRITNIEPTLYQSEIKPLSLKSQKATKYSTPSQILSLLFSVLSNILLFVSSQIDQQIAKTAEFQNFLLESNITNNRVFP